VEHVADCDGFSLFWLLGHTFDDEGAHVSDDVLVLVKADGLASAFLEF
jgi:hypothetical protein